VSYHAHSTKGKENVIIAMLSEGKNLALVSDAGTPCISDPGVMLVAQVYESFGSDARVVPIPGASALVSAISASGISAAEFIFLGFLPHKKGRETLFKEIAGNDRTYVFYESSHRIMKTLESLSGILDEKRTVVVCRELTKTFEQFVK
jgi:16S rRNA (cytidine1402-2'-O)-methyltransferase